MAQLFNDTAKAEMLDALTANKMSLHSGDPGLDGSQNEISGGGYARQSCTFAAASAGVRQLSAAVDFSGPASQSVAYIGVWEAGTPDTFKARIPITSGDTTFNASGQYQVTTDTKLQLSDPA